MTSITVTDCTVIPKRLTTQPHPHPYDTALLLSNDSPIGYRHVEPPPMIPANQKSPSDASNQEPLCNNPAKEAVLLELCKTTGYTLKQENGQRKYGGPPPGWDDPIPTKGCEIFVGKLPRDLYEDELVPVLEKCGRIYELRLMMDFNGNNRGFAFVKYCAPDEAKRALKELNNFEIRKGRLLGVCKSVDNCRLFVGGIPKTKQKEEILVEMQKVTEGVVDVIVYPSAADKTKNRGFAFVEYQDHHTAAMARRKLMHTRPQIWGHPIAVDWAEPEVEVDDDVMATVKILYVRNLMLNTTEEQLEREFTAIVPASAIERVKKIRDYGFIHFNTRENAIKCMKALNGKPLDGAPMEVTLAKPVDRETYVRYTRAANRVNVEPTENLAAYPGLIATTYDPRLDPAAAAAAAVYSYTGAPLYYGGVPYAATTIPALPPGARYAVPSNLRGGIPQIPNLGLTQIGSAGVPLGIPGASTGVAGSQGRGAAMRGRNRGTSTRGVAGRNILNVGRGFQTTYYNHYKRPIWQAPSQVTSVPPGPGERYDLLPGMELIPISPHSLKPSQQQKSPTQLLEEYCKRTGLGMPEYKLHSTVGPNGRQLFLYRVALPASDNQLPSPVASQEQFNQASSNQASPPLQPSPPSPSSLYTPTKLSTSLEVAKEIAAEHVINVLNIQDDSNNNCNDASNDNDAMFVTGDVTTGVAAISIRSPDVNGYTTVYNGASVDTTQGTYAAGYPVFNGVGYTGIASPPNEVYTQY